MIPLPSQNLLKHLKIKQSIAEDEILVFTFGNSGLVKLWSGTTGRCLFVQGDKTYEKSTSRDAEHQQVFLDAYFNASTRLFYANTVDHTIVSFHTKKLMLDKQVN